MGKLTGDENIASNRPDGNRSHLREFVVRGLDRFVILNDGLAELAEFCVEIAEFVDSAVAGKLNEAGAVKLGFRRAAVKVGEIRTLPGDAHVRLQW